MDPNQLSKCPFYLSPEETERVLNTLSGMSEREKCSQLFVILGDIYNPEELKLLVGQYGVGGILYRPGKKEEIRRRFQEADALAKIPLFKAANLEEGGAGILSDGTYFGNALQVAAANDLSITESYSKCCVKEGKAVGVNWSYSPVVDLDLNYQNPITNVRTFGSDYNTVLSNARVYVKTMQQYGIAASCKHYPGDGVDYRDQHLHPTYNDLPADEWFSSYGQIYKELIDEGLLSIMAGHIVQPYVIRAVNPNAEEAEMLPASQSKEMLNGVLREKFGFNGVIITDATIMGGYTMTMKRSKAIPHSLMAGVDMFCFGTDVLEDIHFLEAALSDGRLSRERLDDAVTRVLAMKVVLERNNPEVETDSKAEQIRCAEASATLVKDTQHLLPLTKEKYPKIRLVIIGEDHMYDGSLSETAEKLLSAQGFQVELYDPFEDDLHGTNNIPKDRLTLILSNYPTASNQTTVRITWCEKHALEIPRFLNEEASAFISFNNPYHLQDIPRVRTFINAYSATEATVTAAIQKLCGNGSFTGVSPVDPFCGLYDTKL